MKEKAKNIFLLLLVLMFIGYLLVTAILDLTNRKDLYSVHGDRGMEIMEVEHAINGLIPVGKEHFYLLMDSATGQACIVNGSASWFRKNFGADGRALDPAGVNVTSLAKKGDFEVSEELINRVSGMEGLQFVVMPDYQLKMNYKQIAIEKLLVLALAAILVFVGLRFAKSQTEIPLLSRRLFLVAVILFLIFFLRVVIF